MAESPDRTQGQAEAITKNELHHDESEFSAKAFDILLKYLEQTLKNVNSNVVIAFLIIAFLLMVLGIISDLISANRQLIQETLFSARKQMFNGDKNLRQ